MPRLAILAGLVLALACGASPPPVNGVEPTPWSSAMSVASLASASSPAPPTALASSVRTDVLDTFVVHRELGAGPPLVLLHGNPTSSFVWRNVLPPLAATHRCLAPDLVGMGASGKPASEYRFADHARYLDAWFERLGIEDVVLVGYDWGGVLAVDWAARHPGRVRGVALLETILAVPSLAKLPPAGAELFRALRTPGVGERMVLEENAFLARSLDNGVRRGLTPAERAVYAAPFPDAVSRRPMLQWTREMPFDGEPADVAAVVRANARYLETAPIAKLLVTFAGAALLSNAPEVVAWARGIPGFTVTALGPAGHHAPEDAPEAIAEAVLAWLAPGAARPLAGY